ncbi:hypothetical protein P154DRAFT_489648 [Amniculicola lignicola CBS 123094]|uniref:TAFII28-like protein domain-containing protein n=1 Tax=Amniculicola lignicola CBS 123094 TaxID=1392246 RepID=A0A6A5WIJ0_9PLEO|nr:hypothetical protein P154DRAFT_489648 [Amniculicola lignicola CBS 123094]
MASPPQLTNLTIPVPRKRGSTSSLASAAKKRKPSGLRNALSPEAHSEYAGSPLRFSRSPSVDSVATTSVVNSAAGGKKRRRKGDDGQSTTGGSVTGSMRGKVDTRSATGQQAEEDAAEYDDDEEEEAVAFEGDGADTEAAMKLEKEHERLLVDRMDQAQQDRWTMYRRIRLKTQIVRKLINQTLSQSVPQPVVIGVASYTKAFIGDLTDRALTVRDEWAAISTHRPNPTLPQPLLSVGLTAPKNHRPDARPSNADIQNSGLYLSQVDRGKGYWMEVPKSVDLKTRLNQEDKGPLTPAHLREALRRYKRDREGGGAGFVGLSLEGVERTAGRMPGGRRLFK